MRSFDEVIDVVARARGELERVVLDQSDSVTLVLAATIAGGHVLIEDRPGVGKTTLARAIAALFRLDMARIQGTSDLLPTDITGVHVYQSTTGTWSFRPGPVLKEVVLIDELNRATPKAQSALLEAMAEGQVSVDGETFVLPDPHLVIATQNPPGEQGTHRLVSAQRDRFAVCVDLGLPGRHAERELVTRAEPATVDPVGSAADLGEVRRHVYALAADAAVIDYALDVVDAVRASDASIWLSVRVPLVLLAVARGLAVVDGRDYVAPDDVLTAAPSVIRHRLESGTDHDRVRQTIRDVPIPS